MTFKVACLLLMLAAITYGYPYKRDGNIDRPNQGFDPGFGNQGQGGFGNQGNQGGYTGNPGFGYQGQGGNAFPDQAFGRGGQNGFGQHRGGYKEFGY